MRRDVFTNPWHRITKGSNARLSSVKPCDLCIVRAHASWIGNCFLIFKLPVFADIEIGFVVRSMGVQSLEISSLYRKENLCAYRRPPRLS